MSTKENGVSRRTLAIETLESREVFSASPFVVVLDGSALNIEGTNKSDRIIIQAKANDQRYVQVVASQAGGPTFTRQFLRSAIDSITVRGWEGNDNIKNHTAIPDRMYGNSGNDTLIGGGGISVLDGGSGNDTLNGRGGNDILYGRAGNDTLIGGGGFDALWGGEGNDTLKAQDGYEDNLQGQAGTDSYYVDVFYTYWGDECFDNYASEYFEPVSKNYYLW